MDSQTMKRIQSPKFARHNVVNCFLPLVVFLFFPLVAPQTWGNCNAGTNTAAEVAPRPAAKEAAETTSRNATKTISRTAESHPFVQTIADVFVNRDTLTVRIASSADELDLIHQIVALESGKYDNEELLEGVDIHADFLLERFEIYDPAGNKLVGKLTEKPNWELPAEGIDDGRLIDYMLNFQFEYRYTEPPEYLTFQNHIIAADSLLPSEVKLTVKQAGSDVPYANVMKVKRPVTVRFDWDKPLQNIMTGDELDKWFDETREKTLGVTDVGGVYSFIYVSSRSVRQEVLIPVAVLKEFMYIEHKDRYYLDVQEQDKALPEIKKFFSELLFEINGRPVKPNFDRIDFGGLDVRDFGLKRDRKRVSIANGRVGVIMSFPTRNIPDTVSLTWDKFSRQLRDLEVILVGPDGTVDKKQFTRVLEKNVATWTNPGIPPLPDVVDVKSDDSHAEIITPRLPVISLACIAAALIPLFGLLLGKGSGRMWFGTVTALLISAIIVWPVKTEIEAASNVAFLKQEQVIPGKAEEIFSKLHTNLFRAFDYNTEEAIYDALARTTDGPMLKKIYLDMRRSLEDKEQGGAVATIQRVEITNASRSNQTAGNVDMPGPGFAYRCSWELEGSVEHWGHIHQRTNRYTALFNVENVQGQWKFTAFQVDDVDQGPVKRSLRKF